MRFRKRQPKGYKRLKLTGAEQILARLLAEMDNEENEDAFFEAMANGAGKAPRHLNESELLKMTLQERIIYYIFEGYFNELREKKGATNERR